jgi:hypothetical protein
MKHAGFVALAVTLVSARAPAASVHDDQAAALLWRIAGASSAAERTKAAAELTALSPMPVEALNKFLQRERKSTDAARRAVLESIGADVPDAKGKFSTPRRQTDQEEKANDEFDWYPKLAGQSGEAAGEVVADIAAIRALAASETSAGGEAILRFTFSDAGIAYRDECGRYLRKMSPWSLPALIRASEASDSSLNRYATYQLERLDREDPNKAIRYAGDEGLTIEIILTLARSGYRTGIYPVMGLLDDVNPRLRKAAREAWLEYVGGKPPRPAPRQRLQLPGGRMTPKPVALWMNHRELADIELRRVLEALTGKPPAEGATLKAMTEDLFAFYDKRRDGQLGKTIDAALAHAKKGELAEATRLCDQVLAQQPDHPRRDEMASVYFDHAEALAEKQKWNDASMQFSRAAALDPESQRGKQALAKRHYAHGKALESEGHDASAEFARAREAGAAVEGSGEGRWMLFVGGGIGLLGLVLAGIGFAIRRR